MIPLEIEHGKLDRKVKPFGSGAHVIAPLDWLKEDVILISPTELQNSEAKRIIIKENGVIEYEIPIDE